jgi:hypothetical protein
MLECACSREAKDEGRCAALDRWGSCWGDRLLVKELFESLYHLQSMVRLCGFLPKEAVSTPPSAVWCLGCH